MTSKDSSMDISGKMPGRARAKSVLPLPGKLHKSACYAQKTIAFYLEFCPEIVEQAGYERLTLYSLENLVRADRALGRIK